MSDTGEKLSCKVRILCDGKFAGSFDGLAHVQTVKYDEHFTTCFGSVDLACQASEFVDLVNTDALLELEDQRQFQIRIVSGQATTIHHQQGEFSLFYFVMTFGTCEKRTTDEST